MPFTMYGRDAMLNALRALVITGATGQNTGDTITKTAHGLANGQIVTFPVLTGGTGLTVGTTYFVISTAANTFQVALTPGGSAVVITADYTDVVIQPGAVITHVGLLATGTPLTAVTSVNSTDTFTKTSHGLTAGDLVVLSGLTGGSALVAGRPYFVIAAGITANDFRVSHYPGGSAVDHGSDVTVATVTKLTELAGGSPAYARKAIAYAFSGDGQIDDSNNGIDVDIEAGDTVNYAGYFSGLTGGALLAITLQTAEGPYGAQGIYRVTDSKQHLNGTGGS